MQAVVCAVVRELSTAGITMPNKMPRTATVTASSVKVKADAGFPALFEWREGRGRRGWAFRSKPSSMMRVKQVGANLCEAVLCTALFNLSFWIFALRYRLSH